MLAALGVVTVNGLFGKIAYCASPGTFNKDVDGRCTYPFLPRLWP